MNLTATDLNSPAAEEAALWAARLDGDRLDDTRRAELDAWLARDPRHRVLLSRYCQFSADLEEQLPALVASGAVKMPAAPVAARRGWGFPQFAGLGLAAAAAVAVGFWIMRPAGGGVQSLATSVAQHSAHTLADGTRVELNARTSLRFEATASERRVRLAGGEAYFAVAKDPARPFVVETPAGSVRVTGTTFTVRNDAAGPVALEVLVVEGSVQVRPSVATGAPVALKAGDRLSAGARGVDVAALPAAAVENALAWREGRAIFEGTPLGEAAACFARYHGWRIEVAPEVAALRVGGLHRLGEFDAFANAIETALPVKVSRDLSGAISIGARLAR